MYLSRWNKVSAAAVLMLALAGCDGLENNPGGVNAGDFDDAWAAYKRGDNATAVRHLIKTGCRAGGCQGPE